MSTIISEIQSLTPSGIVDLYELDLSGIGGTTLYFHALRSANDIVWKGVTYIAFPIEMDGFEVSGDKQSPRPTAKVANVSGFISSLLKTFDDLLGAKLTRRRTLVKFLDAVNFPGGVNPAADPTQEFADEVWFVDRKANEDKYYVTLELAAPWDLRGIEIPRRPCGARICPWKYRGPICRYTGPAVADINNNPTSDLSLDNCSKTMTGCKLRYGTNPLPIGIFPAVGTIR